MRTESANTSANTDSAYRLPSGRTVHHLNKYETDFTYREIFEDQVYLQHGITLPRAACVFDVGANIGLFTLFVHQQSPEATVYAFEPSPVLYQLLRMNVAEFEPRVRAYQCGIAAEDDVGTLTYYPAYSIMSGFHADAHEDMQTLSTGILNQVGSQASIANRDPRRLVDNLVAKKLAQPQQVKCQLRTISTILREVQVQWIDLLKIDVEKAELAVLCGIDDPDWSRIRQVVLEVHGWDRMQQVSSLLEAKGFDITTEQDSQFTGAEVFNVYARTK